MEKLILIMGAILASFGGILLLSFILSWPVMMLWNGCLVDAITGVKDITWLQGWGISVLSGILFNKSK
jgi:hypothetical protein